MAKKNKTIERTAETQEQKEARWAKNLKLAKSFAKQQGLAEKVKAEREQLEKQRKRAARGSNY